MVEAMLALFQTAMETAEYCRFVLLSGCDYPIVSNNALWEMLSGPEKEYINASPLPEHKLFRIQQFWAWKIPNVRIFGLINRVMRCLWKKKTYILVRGEKWPVYTSSQWVALTGQCVAYCMEVLRNNPCIMRYFRYSYAPDELVLAIIIANSPTFSPKAVYLSRHRALSFDELPAAHYLRYEARKGSTVRVSGEEDFDEIRASGKMFVRKVYSGKSEGLCKKLDAARMI